MSASGPPGTLVFLQTELSIHRLVSVKNDIFCCSLYLKILLHFQCDVNHFQITKVRFNRHELSLENISKLRKSHFFILERYLV